MSLLDQDGLFDEAKQKIKQCILKQLLMMSTSQWQINEITPSKEAVLPVE